MAKDVSCSYALINLKNSEWTPDKSSCLWKESSEYNPTRFITPGSWQAHAVHQYPAALSKFLNALLQEHMIWEFGIYTGSIKVQGFTPARRVIKVFGARRSRKIFPVQNSKVKVAHWIISVVGAGFSCSIWGAYPYFCSPCQISMGHTFGAQESRWLW